MKNLFLLIVVFSTFISCSPTKSFKPNPYYYTYLDENGETLSYNEFHVKWRDRANNLVRWDYKKDTGRVAVLKEPLYSRYDVTYPAVLKKLEAQTGKKFEAGTIFLLKYTYLNDMCSEKSTNNWNKKAITSRKKFTTPNKKQIELENKDITVLHFFEDGILLENNPASAEEYYFLDEDNFLRKNFFKNPTLCGSFALIKPDGTTLIRNGEHTAKMMAEHLQPTIWGMIFTE